MNYNQSIMLRYKFLDFTLKIFYLILNKYILEPSYDRKNINYLTL